MIGGPVQQDADVLIIGAGPAGMAAATTAAHHGATTVLLDEQAAPGGQIYRSLEAVLGDGAAERELFGKDYAAGARLIHQFRTSGVQYVHSATVWNIEMPSRRVFASVDGQVRTYSPRKIIIASGAMERSVPFPGWTLPGVFGAGAAQILMKSAAHIPHGNVILFGSGPLLLLVANQLSAAGVSGLSVLETTRLRDYVSAVPLLVSALAKPVHILKGLRMRASLMRRGVRIVSGVTSVSADGDGLVESLNYTKAGKVRTLPADVILVHEGVVPNTQLTRSIGAEHEWYSRQLYWMPRLSPWGETSHPGIFAVGDGARIEGAEVATLAGGLAALEALFQLGRITQGERDDAASRHHHSRRLHRPLRRFLDALYRPPVRMLTDPSDETIICRCSEVSAGSIRAASVGGCRTPDELKSALRCGMGPCQGRICGLSVNLIMSSATGCSPDEVGYFNVRAPIKPISLKELSSLGGEPCLEAR